VTTREELEERVRVAEGAREREPLTESEEAETLSALEFDTDRLPCSCTDVAFNTNAVNMRSSHNK